MSVPYTCTVTSALVTRSGVTDILVKANDVNGWVGWGESASGANTESVTENLRAMKALAIGRSSWDREAIRELIWSRGIWQYRKPTACFAFAGIAIALANICGKESN